MIDREADIMFWISISLLLKLLNLLCFFVVIVVDQCKGYFEPVGILKQWVCVAVSKTLQ